MGGGGRGGRGGAGVWGGCFADVTPRSCILLAPQSQPSLVSIQLGIVLCDERQCPAP